MVDLQPISEIRLRFEKRDLHLDLTNNFYRWHPRKSILWLLHTKAQEEVLVLKTACQE